MIYGLIPIGGKGVRLSLPFSKEMLPQKNYGYFNPVANHLVEKMLFAGAEKIIFIHGKVLKTDVAEFFDGDRYIHFLQNKPGFSQVLIDAIELIPEMANDDKVLFGLPDSVFDGNPFVEMVDQPGICAGVFQTYESTKVDRLNLDGTKFQIKTAKNTANQDWFWGVLKFDVSDLFKIRSAKYAEKYSEIGDILNEYDFTLIHGRRYIDIGTWENYNKYISDMEKYSCSEIEKKYDASSLSVEDFDEVMKSGQFISFELVESSDHYFTSKNKNIEFIRFREKADGSSQPPDITVKSLSKNSINRFELEVQLSTGTATASVLQLLKLLGMHYEFKVMKKCRIYNLQEAVVVFYELDAYGERLKFIEIELLTANYGVMLDIECRLSKISGFDPGLVINSSKFKIISKIRDRHLVNNGVEQ